MAMKKDSRNQSQSAWSILDEELANLNMCLVGAPRPPKKQPLIDAISQHIDLDAEILHEHLGSQLEKHFENSSLPRRLAYIYNDRSIIDDYKKDATLVSFAKITLQMVSMIYEKKILLYSIGSDQFLTALIVNEGSYSDSSCIRIGKVGGNSFVRIEEIIPSCHFHQISNDKKQSNSREENRSEQLYQAFKSETFLDIGDTAKKNDETSRQHLVQSTTLIGERPPILRSKPSLKPDLNNFGDNLSIKVQDQQEQSSINLRQIPNLIEQAEDKRLIGECNGMGNPGNNSSNPHAPNNYQGMIPSGNGASISSLMNDQMYHQHQGQYNNYYQMGMYYGQPRQQYPSNYHMNRSQPNISLGSSHQTPQSPLKRNPNQSGNQSQRNGESGSVSNGVMLPTNEKQRYTGRLKFFDEGKNYGFIIMDIDQSDIFVHYDDIQKAGIMKDRIKSYKQNQGLIRFSFKVMEYYGKYDKSRKAVQLIIEQTDFTNLSGPIP